MFEDLLSREVLVALVRAVRSTRRDRVETTAALMPAGNKGRYECGLIENLIASARLLGIAEDKLSVAIELSVKTDPGIIGQKVNARGEVVNVYKERRIGPHHAEMLKAFSDENVFGRWLGAPMALWKRALKRHRAGKAITIADVALARSAIIAQISQRASPLRRPTSPGCGSAVPTRTL